MGIEQLELMSLLPDDFRQLVRDLLSPARQRHVATSIVVRARLMDDRSLAASMS